MKLLSWGANSHGQLGHGSLSESCVFPSDVILNDRILDTANVIAISGGGGHSILLDKNGNVFTCGSNTRGQCGFPINEKVHHFNNISYLADHRIISICCGWDSSFAITSEKTLLVWGSNAFGQLGINKSRMFFTSEPHTTAVPAVRKVATGLRHTVLVTENDTLMVCGNGRKGQLGLIKDDGKPIQETVIAESVPNVSRVHSVSCGEFHTIALTDSGSLLVWGDNKYGQLGLDPTVYRTVLQPTELNLFLKEQLPSNCTIVCGWTHSLLITEYGDVYNWGRNDKSQLGCSDHRIPLRWQPQKMDNIERVKQIAVGSEHNVALLDCGNVMSWGWNEHGSCGNGTEHDISQPTPVEIKEGLKPILVAAGCGHSFALLKE